MTLSINRYLCYSVLPVISKHVHLLEGCDHKAALLDAVLHTIYRMSKGTALTKAQREVISNALVSLAG